MPHDEVSVQVGPDRTNRGEDPVVVAELLGDKQCSGSLVAVSARKRLVGAAGADEVDFLEDVVGQGFIEARGPPCRKGLTGLFAVERERSW